MPALRERIAVLRAKYLDVQLAAERADPVAFVPDVDDMAAFRLLTHAEFEEYLESKARDGLAAVEFTFKAGRTAVRDNLLVLVVARALGKDIRLDTRYWATDVLDTIKQAQEWIVKNNGIKDASFGMLSLFSGKMPDEVDAALSASLSTYGTNRGDVAHRSAMRVRTIQAPSAEAQVVDDLVNGMDAYFA
jgi:hypothetical protein